MPVKDFSQTRAAARVANMSEEMARFGAQLPARGGRAAPAAPRSGGEHRMTVIVDDDLYWRCKAYFSSPGKKWANFSDMVRSLVSREIAEKDEAF